MEFKKTNQLRGEITVPGDKSISHRGVMLGAIAQGITQLDGFLNGADCRSTISCFQKMGIEISQKEDHVTIYGKGLHGLKQPVSTLDVGNSGTTTRLISGILSGQNFSCTLNGDASIQKRPMMRIMKPLREMGAAIVSINQNDCAPLEIQGKKLHAISYQSPVASAQIKSCVLLAGLYASGKTSVTEPAQSRNHTELMVNGFGGQVETNGLTASITGGTSLTGQHIIVPGDISSAAYFIAAGLIHPNATIHITNVNTNPTRAGILQVAQMMGGNVTLDNNRVVSGENVCDITVSSSSLHGVTIGADMIPALIDEIPIIAVMACFASGTTCIKDAQELKVKESNRIDTVVDNLKSMGADIVATEDGMIINGGRSLHGATIHTHLDHRIAMAFAIAGICADDVTTLDHPECVDISYPDFYDTLSRLSN